MLLRYLYAILFVACFNLPVSAHKPSDSYFRIDRAEEQFSIEWDIAVRDLELLVGIDSDQDNVVTWGEVKSKKKAIFAHAMSHITISSNDTVIPLLPSEMKVTQHSDGAYAVLYFDAKSVSRSMPIDIEYRLLFAIDPTHRGLVLLKEGDNMSTFILSPESPKVRLDAEETSLAEAFVEYVGEGVWHIWIGFDHVLFLISLLLPSVLVWRDRAWHAVDFFRPGASGVLRIVTMFTLAHSITLWLSVMEYVKLPSQWVEATIALSIFATAISNLYPKLFLAGWKVAFGFGLIHGFGFANVLIDLGLSNSSLAVALLGFNIGVELGQIAIVLAFLPIAYALRNTKFYEWVVLKVGSALIGIIAAIWLYERIFNAEILGF